MSAQLGSPIKQSSRQRSLFEGVNAHRCEPHQACRTSQENLRSSYLQNLLSCIDCPRFVIIPPLQTPYGPPLIYLTQQRPRKQLLLRLTRQNCPKKDGKRLWQCSRRYSNLKRSIPLSHSQTYISISKSLSVTEQIHTCYRVKHKQEHRSGLPHQGCPLLSRRSAGIAAWRCLQRCCRRSSTG
jgi:hypothetical protein